MFSLEEHLSFFEKCMFWIKIVGLDPRRQGVFTAARPIFGLVVMILQCIVMAITIFHWEGVSTLTTLTESLPTVIQSIFKIAALIYHRKILAKFCRLMKEFWPWDAFGAELEEEIRGKYTFMKLLYSTFNYANMGTLLLFAFKPVLIQEKVIPSPRWNFCDISKSICFCSTYAGQLIEFSYVFMVNTGFDALFFCIITYVHCELAILKYGFQKFHKTKDGRAFPKSFSDLIVHHNMLLDLIKDINKLYSVVLLSQLGSTVVTICIEIIITTLNGFPPALKHVAKNGAFVICYLVELGIYCLGGSQISSQFESVADAVYSSNWVDYDSKLRKGMVLIMQRSQRQLTLKIGGMVTLNLETFVSVVNFTFSFVTLMQKFLD